MAAYAQSTKAGDGEQAAHHTPVTVLTSYPGGQPQGNPYRVILDRSLRQTGQITLKHFTWRTALAGRYDVFHVHWPETLLHGRTRGRLAVRQLLFAALLARLRLGRIPIVRTQHNTDLPKGLDRVSTSLIRAIDNQTTLWIRLNEHTAVPDPRRCVDSTHGHYREWFSKFDRPDPTPGRIVFFGLVRRYKGVDRLIDAFRSGPRQDTSLHVVGKPTAEATRQLLIDRAARDPRVTLRLELVDDKELVDEICAAQLVVLPYSEMHNSAAVITALSLDRPVLVPDNMVTETLAEEIGQEWVCRYRGELSAGDITTALQTTADLVARRASPNLTGRDWSKVAASHVSAYRRALSIGA